MRAAMFLLLMVAPLFAGCAQLDDAKEAAAEAQQKIDDARREAQEAKDRFDRVRSATVVRAELATLRVFPVYDAQNESVSFNVTASRGDAAIPRANLTRAPAVAIAFTNDTEAQCDPLTCTVRLPRGHAVRIGWADEAERSGFPPLAPCSSPDGQPVCATPAPFPGLAKKDAEVLVTTAIGDITS